MPLNPWNLSNFYFLGLVCFAILYLYLPIWNVPFAVLYLNSCSLTCSWWECLKQERLLINIICLHSYVSFNVFWTVIQQAGYQKRQRRWKETTCLLFICQVPFDWHADKRYVISLVSFFNSVMIYAIWFSYPTDYLIAPTPPTVGSLNKLDRLKFSTDDSCKLGVRQFLEWWIVFCAKSDFHSLKNGCV